jgi:thimet oligopeptidase
MADPNLAAAFKAVKFGETEHSPEKDRLYQQLVDGFEISGATLPAEKRGRFITISKRLTQLTEAFSKNINEDNPVVSMNEDDFAGLPDKFKETFDLKPDQDGVYAVPCNEATAPMVLRFARKAEVRKKFQIALYSIGGEKNVDILEEALALRHELAQLRASDRRPRALAANAPVFYADYAIEPRLAKSKARVLDLLNTMRTALEPKLFSEMGEMLTLKQAAAQKNEDVLITEEVEAFHKDGTIVFQPWDLFYYVDLLKNARMKAKELPQDVQSFGDYVSIDSIIAGTFKIYSTLFGITFNEIPLADYPESHWDLSSNGELRLSLFEVRDTKTSQVLGYFYLDAYPRANKYSHFAVSGIVTGGTDAAGKYHLPLCVLMGNFKKRSDHEDVKTFFHEFGHVMDHTLNRSPYYTLVGTPRDFVEAPSQMMENWTWTKAGLDQLAHTPIPADLLQTIIASREVQEGAWFWSRQIFYATVDIALHSTVPDEHGQIDIDAIWRDLFNKSCKYKAPDAIQYASFGHLIAGYSAGYYGYIWSRAYSQDMFTRFKGADENSVPNLFNAKVGGEYRRFILETGDSQDEEKSVTEFLGRPFNTDAFFEDLGIAEKKPQSSRPNDGGDGHRKGQKG